MVSEYVQDEEIAKDFVEYYHTVKNSHDMSLEIIVKARIFDKVHRVAETIYSCEYERYFAKNVLNMTNDIFEIYRRTMTDFRYDTYSVAEAKRQKIMVHEETNFLSDIEMAAMKNSIKFVDDIAVKHARGRDEFYYADEMQKNVSKEFEDVLPNYEKVLLDTRVVIKEAWDFAKRCLTAEEMELFTKQMSINYHVKNFGNWADEPLMDCGIVACD